MSTPVFVVVVVLSIGIPVLVVVTTLLVLLNRKARQASAALAAELMAEPPVLGPENGIYRGSTGSYPKVVGNGKIALTERRILFRKTVGKGIDVPLSDVTGVRTDKSFNRSRVGGKVHLIVNTHHGEVGYFVGDLDTWARAISQRAGSKA